MVVRILLIAALASLIAGAALGAGPCARMYADTGRPAYRGDPPPHKLLCRRGYVLSHNSLRKTPDWVVELLDPERFEGPAKGMRGAFSFVADPDLAPAERAAEADYEGYGFDRGHMAPAADMAFAIEALRESFYLSNVAPQRGQGMNRHLWADLERLARDWACGRGRLVVITGPIFGPKPRTIGRSVAVPRAFYKIAFDAGARRAVAFILPNRAIDRNGRPPAEALERFLASVDEVERETGLDFFTAFSEREQARIERPRPAMWEAGEGCR